MPTHCVTIGWIAICNLANSIMEVVMPLAKRRFKFVAPALTLLSGCDIDWDPDHRPGPQEPREISATVHLNAQPILSGPDPAPRPYVGQVPEFDGYVVGELLEVTIPLQRHEQLVVLFMKPGRSTAECGNINSVVPVAQGATLTAQQMAQAWGVSQPPLPLQIAACVASTGQSPESIALNVRYIRR